MSEDLYREFFGVRRTDFSVPPELEAAVAARVNAPIHGKFSRNRHLTMDLPRPDIRVPKWLLFGPYLPS
jgi:hypothetical protein